MARTAQQDALGLTLRWCRTAQERSAAHAACLCAGGWKSEPAPQTTRGGLELPAGAGRLTGCTRVASRRDAAQSLRGIGGYGRRLVPRMQCRGGQHTAEFAVLIGTVAIAVLAMVPFVQRALRSGMQRVNEDVLHQPLTSTLPNFVVNDTTKEFVVDSTQTVQEEGKADFSRTTNVSGDVNGRSVNEDARLRVFPGE